MRLEAGCINMKRKNHKTKEQITETQEILSDPQAMREIAEAIEAYQVGKGKTLAQLKKELLI